LPFIFFSSILCSSRFGFRVDLACISSSITYYICFIFHENQLVVVVAITSCSEPKIAKRPKPDQLTGSKPHYSSTRRHLRRNGITRNSVAISATKNSEKKASREQPR
jgi:hypothetical protein